MTAPPATNGIGVQPQLLHTAAVVADVPHHHATIAGATHAPATATVDNNALHNIAVAA
eukprot:CAMPEP_0198313012 /NCGR_PEP_ID=MMETSP1450-20131203/4175_1 /TAXON_ID=753684 ORGANISM="Madagascaria erythrocladiodes, Strain CCMP3234" /NCGR_SAMPLE_ID=MMETSP1450 /ASSEMBLY_ACC=CAM_ASM_001115 /LENGTH=57 /DNA_ID=CAMNT_0044015981 /DNA_START=158 /DNA_END=332 /DNA_ORIENTATION=-